jgi:hypothetical protein
MEKIIKKRFSKVAIIVLALLAFGIGTQSALAATFDSGTICTSPTDSTSTDIYGHICRGPFSPAVNTVVTLPPDGILDYASVTIPAGVTVSFTKNAGNTPIVIRTYGNVTIEGVIDVRPTLAPTNSGASGDGNIGDDGQPGVGGPGGYDGGFGGSSPLFGGVAWQTGGAGKGPGGGGAGTNVNSSYVIGGGGASFGTSGANAWSSYGVAGSLYGQTTLLPIVGGSGGGGGIAGTAFNAAGGGGGGGAILISAGTASSPATITVGKSGTYGYILADGGAGGNSSGSGCGGEGGGGSGGAIRLVANTLNCPGGYCRLYARGGAGGSGCWSSGGAGGKGIIRLEYNINTTWNTGYTDPAYSFGLPGHVLVPNNPTLMITSVTPTTGTPVSVPANPTGNADIVFPTGTATATISLTATNIPVGTTVTVYVVPASGANRSSAFSNALSGSDALSTATASITLSPGNNVLLAAATYTVTEIIAFNLPTFDDGIRVAKIRVESTMGGESKVTYITASGKEYPADSPLRDKPKKG